MTSLLRLLREHVLATIIVGAIVASVGIATIAATSAPAGAATTTYASPTLGYQVTLPTNFRRSDLYSYVSLASDPFYVGQDVLTAHTDAAERADTSRTMGPTLQWTVFVEVLRNPLNLTPLQFLNKMEWAQGQTTQNLTFAGSPATLLQNGARFPQTYYVSHGGNMYLISYSADQAHPFAGATANDLKTVVQSFKFTR